MNPRPARAGPTKEPDAMKHRTGFCLLTLLAAIAALFGLTGFAFAGGEPETWELDTTNQLGRFDSTPIVESSGLAPSRTSEWYWTHNDNDTDGKVYLIEFASGTNYITEIATWQFPFNFDEDPEDMATGPGCTGDDSSSDCQEDADGDYLYVADSGNNHGNGRNTFYIYRTPEPAAPMFNGTFSNVDTISYQFPSPYDCDNGAADVDDRDACDVETLMVDANGDLYLVTKRQSRLEDYGYNNEVFVLPYPQDTAAAITLTHVITLPGDMDWLTAGDISETGHWIVLRSDLADDVAYAWYRATGDTVEDAMDNDATEIDLENDGQGEGIAWSRDADDWDTSPDFRTTTETENASVYSWEYVIDVLSYN